ncbi:hypothetical protein J5N97_015159 [Dioscorea zingiberensis]|uniref:Uncharacterized protein n=1 Tax=Dioscorea zingiberensis TaxID=325984 RepID=A0A9D5CTQ2_9LILI|nr:hypothetical protein J5N97_015159 [Dioscorea zingiberensis]
MLSVVLARSLGQTKGPHHHCLPLASSDSDLHGCHFTLDPQLSYKRCLMEELMKVAPLSREKFFSIFKKKSVVVFASPHDLRQGDNRSN